MQLSNNEIRAPWRALRPPTVLIVEDNSDARGQLAGLLRGYGFDVTEASDGKEALGKLRGGAGIDLVLLDLWLPIMDGWSFRAEQRAEKALSEIPVVVMTADDSAQARTIHANAVLRKPFGAETLCRTIRRVLAEKEQDLKGSALLLSETLSLVAGAMGHEIGNALVGLNVTLENARDAGTPEEDLQVMADQCARIGNSLRTLRGLSCPHWTRESPVDLDRVARSAIARANSNGAAWVAFDGLDGAESAWISGDPLVLTYLCTALIDNALEAVPRAMIDVGGGPSPDVDVRVRRSANAVVFEVRDFGAPIPEDELRSIFSVNSPGRGRAWGAGIRLWFARQIVEMLGGAIEVSNLSEGGVRCRVRLPAAPHATA